jgi:imidazolonepropionase
MRLFFNPLILHNFVRSVLYNAGPIVAFSTSDGAPPEDLILNEGMAIVIEGDSIVSIEDSEQAVDEYSISQEASAPTELAYHDLQGRAVVPGLIDAHTHLLWSGDRSREVRLRREGMSYREIAASGGGIQSTVRATRNATVDELFQTGYVRLREALRTGTTYLEAKSGYGLSTESELRLLEVANRLNHQDNLPGIHPTWMGAHDVPKGVNADAYVEELISDQLPSVVEQGIAKSADVFCEPGWFGVDDSERILRDARDAGLQLRMHIDEFDDGGGGALAAELEVATADHAYHTPFESRMAMKESGVMTGFLPGTPYAMGDAWPDMGLMKEHDLPFSLATDFNPNCQTLSLPFMMSLMVQRCGVHPLEVLRATTWNAAQSTPHPTGRPHGCIVEGGVANLNIVDSPHWEAVALRPTGTPFAASVLEGQFIPH